MKNLTLVNTKKSYDSEIDNETLLKLVSDVKTLDTIEAREALANCKSLKAWLDGVSCGTVRHLQGAFNLKMYVEACDYYAAAWLGLMDAVAHFDVSKKQGKFISYAYNFVKSAVSKAWLKDNGFNNTAKGQFMLSQTSFEDLLETLSGNDSCDADCIDYMSPENALIKKQLMKALRKAFNSLKDITREVVGLCYGLFGYEKVTRNDVADEFGLPVEVINDLLNSGIAELKLKLNDLGYGKAEVSLLAA